MPIFSMNPFRFLPNTSAQYGVTRIVSCASVKCTDKTFAEVHSVIKAPIQCVPRHSGVFSAVCQVLLIESSTMEVTISQQVHTKVQQCQAYMRMLQNLSSGRSVIHDERDNWTANGAPNPVTQRIMMDFNRKLTELDTEYSNITTELIQCINGIMADIPQIIRQVLDGPFTAWRMDQKMAQIGCPESTDKREHAERSLREVMSLLHFLRDIVAEMESSYASSKEIIQWLQSKRMECRRYCHYLVQKSFVVSKQPAMLVKDWTLRMDISAKVMADVPTYGGNKNVHRGPVFCCMIPEKHAEWLRQQQTDIDFSQAPINAWSFGYLSFGLKQKEMTRENCIKAEWNDATGEADFVAVRTKIENRKTNESKDKAARHDVDQRPKNDKMTEKKLYFLFFCRMTIDGEASWIWTLSLPFLVAVQTMQEWHLLGVIFWDTAFSALDAVPCDGRTEVTWKELSSALRWLFDKEVQSERGDMPCRELTIEELNHLGSRIFGPRVPFDENSIVHKSDVFTKILNDSTGKSNPSEQKGFTFWQWFYACMDLLQDKSGKILRYHNGKCRKRTADEKRTMATLFNEGIIRGFVSRDATLRLLKTCRQTNIMMIRFSDNHCRHDDPNSVPAGYLSITCKTVKDGRDTIVNIKPLNRELLSRLTLPFVVAHCENLQNVNYIYVGGNRWVEKKRLTVNYIPILTEYTQYEGYEKLLLNLNHDDHSEISQSNTSSPASATSAQSPLALRDLSISPSSIVHKRTESSSYGSYSETYSPPTNYPTETQASYSPFYSSPSGPGGQEMYGRPPSMAPSRLIELLTEPPSRGALIPSKYDEVLSYLISDTQEQSSSPSTSSWLEFQPEDDATLCRTLAFQ